MLSLQRNWVHSAAILLAVLVSALPALSYGLTIEEAYAGIPHRRTVFNPSASAISPAVKEELRQIFTLAEQATILRVEGLAALRAGRSQELAQIINRYRALAVSGPAARFSPSTQPVRELVLKAIDDHRAFFDEKLKQSAGKSAPNASFTPVINQASGKLHQAYDLLMKAFPAETAHNQAAFFDYLCALDFL